MSNPKSNSNSAILNKAGKAFRIAVREVMAEKKLRGYPAIIWKDGKVVKVPASQLNKF